MMKVFWAVVLLAVFSCSAGENRSPSAAAPANAEAFKGYWYQGKAELTRYDLEQARYGEIHHGSAVLIFVTEDFLPDKQVKYEYGERPEHVESVLKLNFVRKFWTGIYPYSMMTSTFTPVDLQPGVALKLTCSSQEWCGHTYTQLNLRGKEYRGMLHSYFQEEGDREIRIPAALPEDQLWALIRIDPSRLPRGKTEFIPGLQYLRLRHHPARPEKALARLTTELREDLSPDSLMAYRVEYSEIQRTLTIYFEKAFPHRILGWEETMLSGFRQPKLLTTRAVRTHWLMTDYWNKHSVADSTYRKQLGFE